jgi:hypothetical protein
MPIGRPCDGSLEGIDFNQTTSSIARSLEPPPVLAGAKASKYQPHGVMYQDNGLEPSRDFSLTTFSVPKTGAQTQGGVEKSTGIEPVTDRCVVSTALPDELTF